MRKALIITLRVEAPDAEPAPDTWRAAKALLDNSTRIELLDVHDD